MLLAALPLLLWEAFSLVYYGFPFPNTAYAKLHTGIPGRRLALQGMCYLAHAIRTDPVTPLLIAAAPLLAWRQRVPILASLALGGMLYVAYVVKVGGDFMAGRFFSMPFFAAVLILGQLRLPPITCAGASAILLALALWMPSSPLKYTPSEHTDSRWRGIIDERGFYTRCSGLWPVLQRRGEPFCEGAAQGRALRTSTNRVVVGTAIGFAGFYAGPNVHLLDSLALSDPLLARMEIPDKYDWRIGHFQRRIPEGYRESIAANTNLVTNPRLHELHDAMRLITRGPLWNRARWRAILRINIGGYDDCMGEY